MFIDSDRVWILLGKKKSGEASVAELQELDRLLREQQLSGQASEVIDHLWDSTLVSNPESRPAPELWDRIHHQISAPGAGRLFRMPLARWIAAACLVAIAGTAAWFVHQERASGANAPDTRTGNQFATQPGSKSKLQLPDGTQVWLNGNSKLSFGNVGFGTQTREVFLSGEAFFDVVRNEKVPFVIHTGIIDITVKGTAFNVKAYPGEKTIETALVRGLIEITTRHDPDRKIIVKPNEKITIPTDTAFFTQHTDHNQPAASPSVYAITALHKTKTGILPETVWMQTKLEFDDEAFGDLAPKMEEWYNIRIRFSGDAIRQKHFSGLIEKETLQETLKAMQLSFPFTYTINANELTVY